MTGRGHGGLLQGDILSIAMEDAEGAVPARPSDAASLEELKAMYDRVLAARTITSAHLARKSEAQRQPCSCCCSSCL